MGERENGRGCRSGRLEENGRIEIRRWRIGALLVSEHSVQLVTMQGCSLRPTRMPQYLVG